MFHFRSIESRCFTLDQYKADVSMLKSFLPGTQYVIETTNHSHFQATAWKEIGKKMSHK